MCAHLLNHFTRVQLFATLFDCSPTRLLCPWNSPGKNTDVGCHALLQGIFPTQRLKLHLCPLQCSCLGNPMDREAWWATVHLRGRAALSSERDGGGGGRRRSARAAVFLCSQAKHNKLGKCKSDSMRNSLLHCHLSQDIFQEVAGGSRRTLR